MAVKYEIDLTQLNCPARLTVTEDTVEIVKTDGTKKNSVGKLALQLAGILEVPVLTFRVQISDLSKVYFTEAKGRLALGLIQFCVKGEDQKQISFAGSAFANNVFNFNHNYNEKARQIKEYVESRMI